MGEWKLVVRGPHRCRHCGSFVERAWVWFERPLRPTYVVCEPCAHAEIGKAEGA